MRWQEVRDYILPIVESEPEAQSAANEERSQRQLAQAVGHTNPREITEAYEKLIDIEGDRLRSVESRLGSLLGLASIAASLLVGGTLTLTLGSFSSRSRVEKVTAGLAVLYLSAQIVSSTLASIRGLSRSAWLRPTIEDLVPEPEVGPVEYAQRRADCACKQYQCMHRNINFKVTQMAVAHTAVRNFALGSVMIAIAGVLFVLLQSPENPVTPPPRQKPCVQEPLHSNRYRPYLLPIIWSLKDATRRDATDYRLS